MRRIRLAIIGFGRLGRACAAALRDSHELELVGVVTRAHATRVLPHPFEHVNVAGHVRELGGADAALICVPADVALGVAREILQQRLPVIECANLEGGARKAYYEALGEAARHHRVAAVFAAGWDPGALPLVRRLFELLIPHGRTETSTHPGLGLHHAPAVEQVPGVRAAFAHQSRDVNGRLQRYVYVQLEQNAVLDKVAETIRADPLHAGEETLVLPIEDTSEFEVPGSGIVLERRGAGEAGGAGPHRSLLLEARFDIAAFAARIMLDAVRRLPLLAPGGHPYSLWP